jgi:hypothetical protein
VTEKKTEIQTDRVREEDRNKVKTGIRDKGIERERL